MKNRVKELLEKGETALGVWVNFDCPEYVEILSLFDIDWLVFDSEHSPLDIPNIQRLLMPLNGSRITPIIRVPWNDMVIVKRALDIGAQGVLIPWINTVEDALYARRACMYPPEGLRGCGPRRCSSYGLESAEYFATANHETLVIGQIETLQAVNNLDKILETKALDCIFVGPADLATSQGHVGQTRYPENLKTIERILEIGKAHKTPVGIYSLGSDWNNKLIEQGFQFIAIGSTESFFIVGVKEVLDQVGRGRAKGFGKRREMEP